MLVYVQNHKKSAGNILFEMLVVFLCIKPAIDAGRVASGKVQQVDETVDTLSELTYGKGAETIFEAIPAGIMQTYAILRAERVSKTAVVSLLTACCSISFTSASISYDWDVSPTKRKATPSFYGFIANSARGSTFIWMFLLNLTHIVSKFFAMALLTSIGDTWTTFYFTGDMAVYLVYRAIRGDLRYSPKVPPLLSILISGIARFITKVLTDFTCVVFFRHPLEMGGFYWCLNLLLSQASCFGAVALYTKYGDEGTSVLSFDAVTKVVTCTFTLWLISLLGFFSGIGKRYLHTFYDFASGKQFVVWTFKNATSDYEKILVFKRHSAYWFSIKDELRVWVAENYRDVWMAEKPEWFTDNVLRMIPEDFIPKEELKEIEKAGGLKRKQSIVEAALGIQPVGGAGDGSVTGLLRRLSVGGGPNPARVAPAVASAEAAEPQPAENQLVRRLSLSIPAGGKDTS